VCILRLERDSTRLCTAPVPRECTAGHVYMFIDSDRDDVESIEEKGDKWVYLPERATLMLGSLISGGDVREIS